MTIPQDAIWLPGTHVAKEEKAAAKAVEEYASDLMLGYRQDTREWVVFLRHGPNDGEPFPVFGLGSELPDPNEIKRRLYHADVRRHGAKLFRDIQRRNDEHNAELKAEADEASGIAAEALEWGFRKMGKHPSPRVFIPRGI